MNIRVVIADDHQILLDGLSQALDSIPDIQVVGAVSDGADIATAIERYDPDVLLVDVEMPSRSGISAISTLRKVPPTLVVTMHTADEYGAAAREAGAVGFFSKSTPLPDLAAAIRAAASGHNFFDDEAIDETLDLHRAPRLSEAADSITEREREVLRCLVRGISRTEDLAEELFISQKTVKNHLASIYEKLGVNDRAQAVVESLKLGLDKDWE
ncbi:MAG: response regulator transcription factor [Acidimicrobiia bacterium]